MPDYKKKSIILIQGVLGEDALKSLRSIPSEHVLIMEGRPSLEAGKSNARLCQKHKIKPTVICDNMAGFLFFKGYVKQVVIACQYVDKTGALADAGALICAVLAKKHHIPIKLVEGKVKTRFLGDPKDLLSFEKSLVAPKGTKAYVPFVEWVPAKYL